MARAIHDDPPQITEHHGTGAHARLDIILALSADNEQSGPRCPNHVGTRGASRHGLDIAHIRLRGTQGDVRDMDKSLAFPYPLHVRENHRVVPVCHVVRKGHAASLAPSVRKVRLALEQPCPHVVRQERRPLGVIGRDQGVRSIHSDGLRIPLPNVVVRPCRKCHPGHRVRPGRLQHHAAAGPAKVEVLRVGNPIHPKPNLLRQRRGTHPPRRDTERPDAVRPRDKQIPVRPKLKPRKSNLAHDHS